MTVRILIGEVREQLRDLPDESVQCVVTSPPYWGLRDYGLEPQLWGGREDCGAWRGSLGLEPTPELFVEHIVEVFREVRRVLRKDGTLWLNMGDCYAGSPNGRSAADVKALGNDDRTFRDKPFGTVGGDLKPKDLVMMPARVAIALQSDGWWLRSALPWLKRNPMPDSTTDRPGASTEYMFLLTRSARYFYDAGAVRVPQKYNGLKGQDASGFKAPENFNGKHKNGYKSSPSKPDKQRGHSRRHAGFNDQWDKMSRAEQQAKGRNFRNCDLFYASLGDSHGLISGTDGESLALDVATHPYPQAHFATFPPNLVKPCIKAGCPEGGTVLDPFGGAGTVGLVADRMDRDAILIELNPEYAEIARKRIAKDQATRGVETKDNAALMRGADLPLFGPSA